jgi:hypothetical protein
MAKENAEAQAAKNNLSKMHVYMNIFVSESVWQADGYVFKYDDGRGNRKIFDYRKSEDSISRREARDKVVASCTRHPMEQMVMPRDVWHRSMDRLVKLALDGAMQVGRKKNGLVCLSSSEMMSWVYDNKDGNDVFTDNTPGGIMLGRVMVAGRDRSKMKKELEGVPYRQVFPVKKHDGAYTKQNVMIGDVMNGLKSDQPEYYNYLVGRLPELIGLASDQVVCLVMSHKLLWDSGYRIEPYALRTIVYDDDLCKAISDFSKICGIGLNPYLARWAELDCLQGRGVKPADAEKELRELSSKPCREHGITFEKRAVYEKAIKVLREAMPRLTTLNEESRWSIASMNRDEYWNKRTQHCVNGAHHMPTGMADPIKKGTRRTRMVYLETETRSPLYKTEPKICATLSWKMESPKVRAIKAEDTVAYLNEDYIMKVVEKYWEHPQVLLDPGTETREEAGDRVSNMPGKYYVMLDFSAMDKQHSINTQVELMEALMDVLATPQDIRDWMLQAEENQYLSSNGKEVKLKYSLLTGRRMTTFINTVLNRVYLELALGELMPKAAYHAGDDIVFRVEDMSKAREVVRKAIESKNVFNPRKQSLGPSAEFLRVATYGNLSIGYVNRTIASTVCGSWVNKIKLTEATMPSLYARYAWMLDNRGMVQNYASALLSHSMWKRTGFAKSLCKKILMHKVSVDASPVNVEDEVVTIVRPKVSLELDDAKDIPAEGSKVVVNRFVDEFGEQALTKKQRGEVVRVLSMASSMKTLLKGYNTEGYNFERVEVHQPVFTNTKEMRERKWEGVLASHPVLPAIQNLLTVSNLAALVEFTSGLSKPDCLSNKEWLFGNKSLGVVAALGNDYDDMCMLSKVSIGQTRKIMRIKCKRICHT